MHAMKSSTKTSIRVKTECRSASWRDSKSFGSIIFSNAWGGSFSHRSRLEITSLAVSDAAQKNGGDSHHPICSAFGTTIFVSSSEAEGSSFGMI